MNIASWIVQGLLALAFVAAGFLKTFTPIDQLAQQMVWVPDVPSWVPRLAGIAEILGAIGLIVPSLTRIQPKMTVYAAYGLIAVMVLAAIFHLSRGEGSMVVPNIIFSLLAGFVAWVRTSKAPIAPKS
ncbi:MAG: DoxX family protein [Bacteroidia bacterium]|nr:DoxX family protein [Bacteroidia bacterium]